MGSVLWGEWHSVILFHERLEVDAITYAEPAPLAVGHLSVKEAALLLDIG